MVENYSEIENLILQVYNNLYIKDKIYLLTNIKFIKQSINKENYIGSGDDINKCKWKSNCIKWWEFGL